eukprot:3883845-Lingulodinium_polyedra.AAC.1
MRQDHLQPLGPFFDISRRNFPFARAIRTNGSDSSLWARTACCDAEFRCSRRSLYRSELGPARDPVRP